ncbi:MAG: tetratricopeptide repeat protein [bacterium]
MTDDDRWRKIRRVYLSAAERPHAERDEYLREACGDDDALRRHVEALLDGEAHAATPDGETIQRRVDRAYEDLVDEEPLRGGDPIGAYRIIREIASGGMGRVYLAARADEQFEKQVAIKVVTASFAEPRALFRFRRERQILAALEHPNIARLLDGGVSAEGYPFLVMEFVDGVAITEYCKAARPSVKERLTIFLDVCRAVEYAHARLVAHRDLKPGNILVTPGGVPMLLDFGIAKLLSGDDHELSAAGATLTQHADRLFTPAYASPEQVRGQATTTATDVYSLGVILYEMLAGAPPYRVSAVRPGEMERLICEIDPPRPSETNRQLRGDLDRIVLHALQKDPARRYLSVEQFASDIRRHLDGYPVVARPDGWTYRTGKFAHRHWRSLLAGAAIVVTLLVSAVSLWRAAESTARERDRASVMAGFLVDIFRIADPSESRGNTVTAREILDQARDRITADAKMDPAQRADLMDTMGMVYRALGLYADAKPLVAKALDLRREVYGETHESVAASLDNLASVAQEEGDLATAETLFCRALESRERILGESHPLTNDSATNLGVLLHQQARYQESEALLRRALAARQAQEPRDDARLAEALSNLASSREEQGDYSEAERLHREALAVKVAVLGEDHPGTATTINNLAFLVENRGEYREAEALYRRAVAIGRAVKGSKHPDIATWLNNLGVNLESQGRYAEAAEALTECRTIRREALGPTHYLIASDTHRLGALLNAEGRTAEAERELTHALEMRIAQFGESHTSVASTLSELARARTSSGDLDEACALYERALAILRAKLGDAHPRTAAVQIGFAHAGRARGDAPADAEPHVRAAIAVLNGSLGPRHLTIARAQFVLGELLAAQGKNAEAQALLESALATRRGVLPAGHPDIAAADALLKRVSDAARNPQSGP